MSKDIYLGKYREAGGSRGKQLPYDGERHLLLFGPNGSGKATRILVPNLLSLTDRSIVVIDPKGELAAITARFRATVSDVVILNPFGVLGIPSSGFNPLASLDPDAKTFFDDASGIGEALIKIEGKDPHWSRSARSLVVALVMWEVLQAKKSNRLPSLANVRQMMTERSVYDTDADGKKFAASGLKKTIDAMCTEGGYEIASLMGRFSRDSDEIANIQSTADGQTQWMLSRPMRENISRHDLDFSVLKKRPTTVYLILPAQEIRNHNVWLRLLIVSALRALYSPGGLRTLLILDEFAQLERLAPVEDALGLVRGFGVQVWPILQDINQLKSLYKDRAESFTANAGIVLGFAPNDMPTAQWMSERASKTTGVALGYSTGDNSSQKGQSTNEGLSYQQYKRDVFLPQEMFDLKRGEGMLFVAGSKNPVPIFAPNYWDMPTIAKRADPNPYFELKRRTS